MYSVQCSGILVNIVFVYLEKIIASSRSGKACSGLEGPLVVRLVL